MGRILDKAVTTFENIAGPLNWRADKQGHCTTFSGRFHVYDRSGGIKMQVRGLVVIARGLPAEIYMFDPPAFVKAHRHGSCLQLLRPNENWFKFHFTKPAADFAAAYSYVEHFLSEAYSLVH